MRKYIFTVVIPLFLVLAVAGFLYKRYRIPPSIDLPVIALTDLSGHQVSLSSYAGHPLFISFFATWCGPCMRELPELADLQTKLSNQKLQVVCICDEPIEKLQTLQAHFGDKLIILHSEKSFHDINIYTYPTNYIFNAKGVKVYEQVNPEDWESADVINRISQLIL
jgi:thiol-disulfide isomerase/thioredoxin